MSTLGLLPTLVADCDVAVSAIQESTHTSETTPTQGSHETQNIVTFTSSGLTTPARLYQKYMDPVAASMPSQQPLIPAPTPQNLNTFSGLPPLPQHGYSHCDPHQNSCVDSPSPLNTRLMSDASHEHSVGAHSALMARPRKLLTPSGPMFCPLFHPFFSWLVRHFRLRSDFLIKFVILFSTFIA